MSWGGLTRPKCWRGSVPLTSIHCMAARQHHPVASVTPVASTWGAVALMRVRSHFAVASHSWCATEDDFHQQRHPGKASLGALRQHKPGDFGGPHKHLLKVVEEAAGLALCFAALARFVLG